MSRLAIITFLDGRGADIDNGLPVAPVYPGQGLPGWSGPVDPGYGQGGRPNRPENGLPGFPGRPDQGLPIAPNRPDNGLPWVPPPGHIATLPVFPFDPTLPPTGPGQPDVPDNKPPVQIRPGAKFVVKWLACTGLILVPDNSLPPGPGGEEPPTTDNTLPPTAQPK